MSNELVLFGENIKDDLILSYLLPATTSELKADKEEFVYYFSQLYQLPILQPLLNVIITKAKHKEAEFKILPLKFWNRCRGHCTTATTKEKENESVFLKRRFQIVIRSILPEIIIHEIAHAIEHESGIDLNKDFRKILASDVNGRKSGNIQLDTAVITVMKEELKGYELENVMSELFARFFELIGMCYEVGGWSRFQFTYADIRRYFINTINYIESYLIPLLNKKVDRDVQNSANRFIADLEPYTKKWATKKLSNFAEDSGDRKWSNTIKSKEAENQKIVDATMKFFGGNNTAVQTLDNGVEYFGLGNKNNNNLIEE